MLKSYLNTAVEIGIINIFVGCMTIILDDKMGGIANKSIVYYLISALGTGTLVANLFLMYLLFRFMVNRQLWDR